MFSHLEHLEDRIVKIKKRKIWQIGMPVVLAGLFFLIGGVKLVPQVEAYELKIPLGLDEEAFKVPKDITLMVIDTNTGEKAKFTSKNTIIESYKSRNILNGKVLYSNNNRLDINNILRFY